MEKTGGKEVQRPDQSRGKPQTVFNYHRQVGKRLVFSVVLSWLPFGTLEPHSGD
jgi:hypothetical protein